VATVLSIGQVAQIAGCNVRTVRYYEQVGLLKSRQSARVATSANTQLPKSNA
jgi:hypothetical protein